MNRGIRWVWSWGGLTLSCNGGSPPPAAPAADPPTAVVGIERVDSDPAPSQGEASSSEGHRSVGANQQAADASPPPTLKIPPFPKQQRVGAPCVPDQVQLCGTSGLVALQVDPDSTIGVPGPDCDLRPLQPPSREYELGACVANGQLYVVIRCVACRAALAGVSALAQIDQLTTEQRAYLQHRLGLSSKHELVTVTDWQAAFDQVKVKYPGEWNE